jgi:hypothetical protein
MQRIFFAAAIVAALAISSVATAANSAPARSQVSATRKGPVAKLIELERRKNEWLRQQFAR